MEIRAFLNICFSHVAQSISLLYTNSDFVTMTEFFTQALNISQRDHDLSSASKMYIQAPSDEAFRPPPLPCFLNEQLFIQPSQ